MNETWNRMPETLLTSLRFQDQQRFPERIWKRKSFGTAATQVRDGETETKKHEIERLSLVVHSLPLQQLIGKIMKPKEGR